jgi:hypothetical protein
MGSSGIQVDPWAFPDLEDLRQELQDTMKQVEDLQSKIERTVDQELRSQVRRRIDSLKSAEDVKAYQEWLKNEAQTCAARIRELEKG